MGKKKRKGISAGLSKEEFICSICSRCGLCSNNNPEMCYYEVYKTAPKHFNKVVMKSLIDFSNDVHKSGNRDNIDEGLLDVLCKSNACGYYGEDCGSTIGCMMMVREQLGINNRGKSFNNIIKLSKHQKKNKWSMISPKKKTVEVECRNPTPKFFCHPDFEEEVSRIIGDNNK